MGLSDGHLQSLRVVIRRWLFAGFCTVAAAAISYTVVQHRRLDQALWEHGQCAARNDTACAGEALEKARSIDPSDLRSRVGQAQMHALLGEADKADSALQAELSLAELTAAKLGHLTPSARASVLLVAGDIAALRGEYDNARARWTEAAAIVDGSVFVAPRRDRLTKKQEAISLEAFELSRSLRTDFDALFDSASAGTADAFSVKSRALRQRVDSLKHAVAKQKLTLALDAAARGAVMATVAKGSFDDSTPISSPGLEPPRPPPDSLVRRAPWLREQYEREMENYRRNQQRADNRRAEADRLRWEATNKVDASASRYITEARTLVEQGLAALEAGDTPATK